MQAGSLQQQLGQAAGGDDWKAGANRLQFTEKLEEALGGSGPGNSQRARDIENQIFQKAKSKEDYLGMVCKVIVHVKGGAKKEGNSNMQPGNQGHMQVNHPGMQTQPNAGTMYQMHATGRVDPMAALQGLTSRGQGIAGGQAMSIQQQNQLALLRQQQQQMQQQYNMQQQNKMAGMSAAQNPMSMQQGVAFNHQMNQHQIIRSQNFVSPTGQPTQGQMTQQRAITPAGVYPGQPTPPPHQPGMAPSPVYPQQMSPAGLPPQSSQPVPSPSYIHPSPSPQMVSSPASNVQRGGIPSPSISLNTPGNPPSVGSIPSPSTGGPGSVGPSPQGPIQQAPTQNQIDQAMHKEKLRNLLKFIETIQKMQKMLQDAGETRKATQLQNVLDVLSSAEKSAEIRKLIACETLLRMFGIDVSSVQQSSLPSSGAETINTTTTSMPSVSKTHEIYQPLLEAVMEQIDSPLLNHHLQVSFGQALDTLHGKPSSFTAPVIKRMCGDPEATFSIPDIVQGEVARLPSKFHVSLDPAHQIESKSVHLLCKLEDIHLPSVPPLCITVPEEYPKVNPQWDTVTMNTQTQFYLTVRKFLASHLKHMPAMFTITQMLDAWEMSVRKSCLAMSGI